MEIIIILFLILLNGIFAMVEIAVVSARKSRLQHLANEGSKRAQAALDLATSPNRFLSTVQIGITLVGILAGAFGGVTIAKQLSSYFNTIPYLAPYSEAAGIAIVVATITYLTLIFGELVPKRLGLSNPELIASLAARPMNFLSQVSTPLVYLLEISTDSVLHLLQIKPKDERVSPEEVKMLIREGTKVGVFETAEKDIVERTLELGDKKVNTLMTSRKEIIWLEIDSSYKTIRNKIAKNPHSHFPVCRDTLDKVLGIVLTEDILANFLIEEKIDLKKFLHKPLFIPETTDGLKVLELFKKSGIHMALIVDEYGNIQGVISMTDILEAIVGDIPTIDELGEQEIMKRKDGSYLVDGLVPIDGFKAHFRISRLPGEKSGNYHTVGGFIMYKLGYIPAPGDNFELNSSRFEVIDMDGNRVDKILVTPLKEKS
ncbi:HlyC/CorC family transporter [Candidatus Daviesbacteria bacterium]|nr:HlyC/CorC family transporter [Candidatus Daviesbacteria bacterium]